MIFDTIAEQSSLRSISLFIVNISGNNIDLATILLLGSIESDRQAD